MGHPWPPCMLNATMSVAEDLSQAGIGGPLAKISADHNNETGTITVHHVLGADLTASTHISQPVLAKALGVSHINAHNVDAISFSTDNHSDGVVGIVAKTGAGDPLPTTSRHCVVGPNDTLTAVLHAAPPNTQGRESGLIPLKELRTDKTAYKKYSGLADSDKQRIQLNAGLYAHAVKPPSEDDMYRYSITSKNEGSSRVAIPLKKTVTDDDGVLTQVMSRCIIHQKKAPTAVGGAGAKVVDMPSPETGEKTPYLVMDHDKCKSLVGEITENCKIDPLFENGMHIQTIGSVSNHAKPGDHVITTMTLHRTPTGDADAGVTYQADLIPAGGKVSAIGAGASANESEIHQAIWGRKVNAGAAQIIDAAPQASGDAQGGLEDA